MHFERNSGSILCRLPPKSKTFRKLGSSLEPGISRDFETPREKLLMLDCQGHLGSVDPQVYSAKT